MHDLVAGEVALFSRGSGLVAHRVFRNDASGLRTRGDSVPQADPPVTPAEFLGRVVTLERGRDRVPVGRPGLVQQLLGRLLAHCDLMTRLYLRLRSPERLSTPLDSRN